MKTMIYSVFALMLSAPMLTACSDDDNSGDPAKDWNGTTTFFASTDAQGFNTYYMPSIGRVGDPMPFYDQKAGDFKVLYLQEFDNNMDKRFHPIWGVTTKDGANYESLGEVLPFADNDYQQDAALGTGCAYEKEGTYYIYYTGHNDCGHSMAPTTATLVGISAILRYSLPTMAFITWLYLHILSQAATLSLQSSSHPI